MGRMLLCIICHLADKQGFKTVADTFSSWGYEVQVIELDNTGWFNYHSLPALVSETGRREIVLLSNIRTALFSWYRCFNAVFSDFIYFIDANQVYKNTEHYDFYTALASFAGISQDQVSGKIYMNLSPDNYRTVFPFMLSHASYFDDLSAFNPVFPPVDNASVFKQYIYNEMAYIFKTGLTEPERPDTFTVYLKAILPDSSSAIDINSCSYLFFYLILANIEDGINPYFNALAEDYLNRHAAPAFKAQLEGKIWSYLENREVKFLAVIYLMSLQVMLNPHNPKILKNIMSALLQDTQYFLYHYRVLINILFYISCLNLQTYPAYYPDQRRELNRLQKWYRSQLSLNMNKPEVRMINIAIHVDQLLSIYHSPTKVMLDYTKALKKSGYNIHIFVEDNLYSSPGETILPCTFSSAPSLQCKAEHCDYLGDAGVGVFYASPGQASFSRTEAVIKAINDFKPDVILTNSCISIAMDWLYEYYPLIYLSMGGDYFTCPADVYLVGLSADVVLKNNDIYKLMDSTLIKAFNLGFDIPLPRQPKFRRDYQLKEHQFVIITVGNRLQAEMNTEFIDEVCNFLSNHLDTVWLVVGATVPYLGSYYGDLIKAGKIVMLDYEYDLVALYDLCDVYVNPPRSGGGSSITWAMSRKLPVLQMDMAGAGLILTGRENCLKPGPGAYDTELERLYGDVDYRKERGQKMHDRVQSLTLDSSVSSLKDYMASARQHYEKRLQNREVKSL